MKKLIYILCLSIPHISYGHQDNEILELIRQNGKVKLKGFKNVKNL